MKRRSTGNQQLHAHLGAMIPVSSLAQHVNLGMVRTCTMKADLSNIAGAQPYPFTVAAVSLEWQLGGCHCIMSIAMLKLH